MRAEKNLLLEEIKEKIGQAPAFLMARYGKVNPNLAWNLRSAIAGTGGEMEVVRKRIFMKAAESSGFSVTSDSLEGHVAIIFTGNDPLQTTKAVFKFSQDHEEMLHVLGGRFEGAFYVAKDVEALSKLPSKPEMQAMLLGLFEAVPSQLLGTMDALLTTVVHCLDNKSKN